jgi:hypothetical protein
LRRIDDAVERALRVGSEQQRLPLVDADARVARLLGSEAPLEALELVLARLAPPVQVQEQPSTLLRRLRGATVADVPSRASVGDEIRGIAPRRHRPGHAAEATLADVPPVVDARAPAASVHQAAATAKGWGEELRRASTRPAAELQDERQWAERLPRAGVHLANTRTARSGAAVGSGVGTRNEAAVSSMAASASPVGAASGTGLRSSANDATTPRSSRSRSDNGLSAGLAGLGDATSGSVGLGSTGGALGVTGLRKLAALATDALDGADDTSVPRMPGLAATANDGSRGDHPTQPPGGDGGILNVAQPLRAIGPTERAVAAGPQQGRGREERPAYASRREDLHYLEPDLDLLLEQRLARLLRAEALAHGINPDWAIR